MKYHFNIDNDSFGDQSTNFEVSRIRTRVCSNKDMKELRAKFVKLLNSSK